MAQIELGFAMAGGILILGFIGNYLFKKISIPDILILVLLGILAGPVFNIINAGSIEPLVPYFTALALLVILFDGGLNMNLREFYSGSPRAILMGTISFALTSLGVMLFMHYLFGWSLLAALLFGVILVDVSTTTVLPLISRLKMDEKIKTIISIESIYTSPLSIVVAIVILGLMSGGSTGGALYVGAAQQIASAFSVGAIVGIGAGIIWLRVLREIENETYDDILTLAFALFVYGGVRALGGSGEIFALLFGLMLGNGILIRKMFRMKNANPASAVMKKFQSQISFLLRTFFFVYLGLVFVAPGLNTLAIAIALTAIIFASRYAAIGIAAIGSPLIRANRGILAAMLPRGLTVAVLSQLLVTAKVPNYGLISEVVITIILITTVIAAIGGSIFHHKYLKAMAQKERKENVQLR